MKKNSFLEGTFIAMLSIIFIKVLGALYVIPFYAIIGESGGALYSYAYTIYSFFLSISTAGIPIAVSKIITEYNTLGMYKNKEKVYKVSRNAIACLAIFSFLVLFVFAKYFAIMLIGSETGGNSLGDVTMVIRCVSFCLLIIPFLSVIKGYLQAHKYISASSASQIIEQIVRISVILLGSYIVIDVLGLNVSLGVGVAVSGAFFGGVIAYLYLYAKVKRNKDVFNKDSDEELVSTREIIKKVIRYATPIILVNVAVDIYCLTDMTLIIRGLYNLGYSANESQIISSVISTWAPKISMIISSIAMGLSISIVPHMVSSYVNKDYVDLNRKFMQSIGIVMVVGLPMSIGLSILSEPVYTIFYGYSKYGPNILSVISFVVLVSSLHLTVNSVLQSLNKFKLIYLSTILGLGLNAIFDIPFMYLFNFIGIDAYYGAMAATMFGYFVSLFITMSGLKKELGFSYDGILNIVKKLILPTGLMVISLFALSFIMPASSGSLLYMFSVCIVYAIIGGIIYLVASYKNNLLYDALGKSYVDNIINKIMRFFRR